MIRRVQSHDNGTGRGVNLVACRRMLISALALMLSICLLPASVRSDEVSRKPVLAIVSEGSASAFSDVLFAELASLESIQLVERDRLERLRLEQEVAGGKGADALQLGREVKADGVLLIVDDPLLFRVALVETKKGVHIFDYVQKKERFDLSPVAGALCRAVADSVSKLGTPEADRLYLALPSFELDPAFEMDDDTVRCIQALVSAKLMQRNRVILVEREKLGDVAAEQQAGADSSSLSLADIVVRARATKDGSGASVLDLRVTQSGASATKRIRLDMENLDVAANAVVQGILDRVNLGALEAGSSSGESMLQFMAGYTLAQQGQHLPALKYILVASILEPTNTWYLEELTETAVEYLERRAKDFEPDYVKFERDEYMAALFWLEQAMKCERILYPSDAPNRSSPPMDKSTTYTFTMNPPHDLTEEQRLQEGRIRSEMLHYLEWYAGFDRGATNFDTRSLLIGVSPLCFSKPDEALAYMKPLMARPDYTWKWPHRSPFPYTRHWDQAKARKLWRAYMEEVLRENASTNAQLSALGVLCRLDGAFGEPWDSHLDRKKVAKTARRILDWFEEDKSRLDWWYLTQSDRNFDIPFMDTLHWLPLDEQTARYRSLGLHVARLGGESLGISDIHSYLRDRCVYSDPSAGPSEKEDQRALLNETLKAIDETDPKLGSAFRATYLEGESWYEELTGDHYAPEVDYPSGLGTLVFDSSSVYTGTRADLRYCNFNHFAGYADAGVLWLGWTQQSTTRVARVDLASSNVTSFGIARGDGVHIWRAGAPFAICRVGTFLCVAGTVGVYAIPTRSESPFVELDGVVAIGTDMRRNVSALVPAADRLFLGFSRIEYVDGRSKNVFGGISEWRTEDRELHPLCASDSLGAGPLNSCMPYTLVGGCADTNGADVYLFLAGSPGQASRREDGQRQGVWKFSPKTGAWDEGVPAFFGFAWPSKVSSYMEDSTYVFANGPDLFRFDLSSSTVSPQKGLLSFHDGSAWLEQEAGHNADEGRAVLSLVREGKPRKRVLSYNGGHMQISNVFVNDHDLFICFGVLHNLKSTPTDRGLVYRIPLAHIFE